MNWNCRCWNRAFSLVGEVARFLNISCILVSKILRESVDGLNTIVGAVNKYNDRVSIVGTEKVLK